MKIAIFRYEQGPLERIISGGLRYQAKLSDDHHAPCVYASTVEDVIAKAVRKWGEWPTEIQTSGDQRFVGEVTIEVLDREASVYRRAAEMAAREVAA